MTPQENDQTTASSRVDGPRVIIIGLIALILLLFGVLLAQCGDEGNSGQATQGRPRRCHPTRTTPSGREFR